MQGCHNFYNLAQDLLPCTQKKYNQYHTRVFIYYWNKAPTITHLIQDSIAMNAKNESVQRLMDGMALQCVKWHRNKPVDI